MGARDKRPESLLGKEQREGSQAMSVPERAFPAWTRATAADVWGWWETSWEPRESPSPLLQESPEETPRKRRGRSARAPAVGWALPPAGASEECRGPHGSPRCLRPSSGETLPKRRRRCARGPSAAASEAAAVAGWAPPPTGPSERGEETRSWGRRGGGLARFRSPIQGTFSQRDGGSLPGPRGTGRAALCIPPSPRWAGWLPGAGSLGGLRRVRAPAKRRFR